MEGVVLTVRRDGSLYGKFEAMVTVAHTDFYSYVPSGSTFTSGRENVDGTVPMRTYNGVAHGGDIPRGMIATDPAYLVAQYFAGEGSFSLAYTRNSYR